MRRLLLLLLLLVLAGAVGLVVSSHLRPTAAAGDLGQRLQAIVAGTVDPDGPVRNCVLAVATGDGAIASAVAAGVASHAGAVPMTADTPIYIASVTKLYTAATVMLLVERGELALADPVAKFLPATLLRGINSFGGEDHSGEITIADLLSHRSGIADYYTEPAADGKSLADWLRSDPDRQWTVDETIARSRDDLKPHSLPGTATFYSDANFQLLGKVIETVTGKPLDAAFDEVLFRPLGLDHTWLVGHPRPGVAETTPADVFHDDQDITRSRANRAYWADGAIVSTAGDMISFLRALNGGRIVSRQTLALMHQWQSLEFPLKYGYGTMYFSLPWPADKLLNYPPLWGHSGSTGSFLYYAPDLDLYMAGTIDQTEAKTKPFILMARVMKAIRSDPAFRLPPASGGTSS